MSAICVTLMTDFGTADHYVAAVKGAILSVNPGANLVDITHEIEPQNVLHGSFVLAEAAPYFPPATIHVAVVDPGVGGQRDVIYAEVGGQRFVAPDNGLLTFLLRREPARRLFKVTRRRYFRETVSATFHGRDIMGPVAGHLSLGLDPAQLGPPAEDAVRLTLPALRRLPDGLEATVVWVDHFGNVVTNLDRQDLAGIAPDRLSVRVGETVVSGLKPTYESVPAGSALALVGSSGLVEIAVSGGNAAARFGLACGDVLRWETH